MALRASPLTPVDTFSENLNPPQTGTLISAADVEAGEQVLMNRTYSLAFRYLGFNKTLVGPGAQWTGAGLTAGVGDGVAIQDVTAAAGAAGRVSAVLSFWHGMKFQTIYVRLQPDVAHVALPAVMPTLTLYRISLTGASTTLGTVTDTTALLATYITPHDLTLTLGADEVVDKTGYYYLLQYQQENGANSLTGAIGQPRVPFKLYSP